MPVLRSACFFVLLLHIAPVSAQPVTEDGASWAARGAEVVGLVRDHFYDRGAAEAWATQHEGYADAVRTEEEFVTLTKEALASLGASHTGYLTDRESEYYGLRDIFSHALDVGDVEWVSPGADVSPDHFVRAVFAGGPAATAGLRRGDRILTVDGATFEPVGSFEGRAGQPVRLTVERVEGEAPIEVRLIPRLIRPTDEWLQAAREGARLIEHDGQTVAYVPLFSCAGEAVEEALREMVGTRFRDADALIIDFRDGFGGCNPPFVNLFNPAPAVLTYIDRKGTRHDLDAQWRKPLVVLVNGGTTSGKEVVAHSVQRHSLGVVVGERTAGAVLAGRAFLLADGSLLYLAVGDLEVDGVRLEGHGVRPDVEVSDALPFAAGRDPQLERAIDLAVDRL